MVTKLPVASTDSTYSGLVNAVGIEPRQIFRVRRRIAWQVLRQDMRPEAMQCTMYM